MLAGTHYWPENFNRFLLPLWCDSSVWFIVIKFINSTWLAKRVCSTRFPYENNILNLRRCKRFMSSKISKCFFVQCQMNVFTSLPHRSLNISRPEARKNLIFSGILTNAKHNDKTLIAIATSLISYRVFYDFWVSKLSRLCFLVCGACFNGAENPPKKKTKSCLCFDEMEKKALPVRWKFQVKYSAVIVVRVGVWPDAWVEACENPWVVASPGLCWAKVFAISQPTQSHCLRDELKCSRTWTALCLSALLINLRLVCELNK